VYTVAFKGEKPEFFPFQGGVRVGKNFSNMLLTASSSLCKVFVKESTAKR
jgi:hypothetical protein